MNLKTKKKNDQPEPIEERILPPYEGDIHEDPSFQELLLNYQKANWNECDALLLPLLKRYPQDPDLQDFKNEYDLRIGFQRNQKQFEKDLGKNRIKKGSKVLVLSLISILVLTLLIGLGIWYGMNLLAEQNQKARATQIDVLSSQVEALLNSGQPEKAQELIDHMQSIDANNPTYIQLATKTNELMALNGVYDQAQEKFKAGEFSDALAMFQSIQAAIPNYRDVPLMIEKTQNNITVAQAAQDALKAYDESRWEDAITGFETVQLLAPERTDTAIKEKLLNSYLHRIIQMLENSNSSFDDISKAEAYYRRAIAMIPQSKIYQSERENLQKISSDLLTLKYTQTATQLVNDPNQTLGSVNQAANYLKKAANLNPKNAVLQSEVEKITQYQIGLQYYLAMEYEPAIQQLTNLLNTDDAYANGLAKQLLYEAHVGRGKYYFRVGLYLDARREFEAAENLVWDTDNLMNLFMVEIDLAETLGKLQDYQNAASYYKYAVEAVNYSQRAVANPSFVSNLISAVQLYADGSYTDSFELFKSTLADKQALFTEQEVNLNNGTCLAFVAQKYHSTVEVILARNGLSSQTIATSDETYYIPTMSK